MRKVALHPEQEAWTLSCLEHAELHIMGRVTYQGMAQYFPAAAGHPCADVLNSAPKSVLSGP